MKAIVWTKYGAPYGLELQDVEKPTPGDNEVLIRIRATTVTAGDVEMRKLKIPILLRLPMRLYVGLWKPKRMNILGQELAGEIEAVGKDVTRFKAGDAVFAATGFGLGAYAEYKVMPEQADDGALVGKPTNLSYEEAAAVPIGGLEALHFMRKGNIQPGEKVLIVGGGGSIGTFGAQLAKYYGAVVTGVDSGEKFEVMRSIGIDECVDYIREDFTQRGETYDVIFDVVGKAPIQGSLRSLEPNGRFIIANPGVAHLRLKSRKLSEGRQVITSTISYKPDDLLYLKDLIEAGKIKPVVDRVFPLEQAAEAHRYVETGGKKGNVVIKV